jgi:hypothetical protein
MFVSITVTLCAAGSDADDPEHVRDAEIALPGAVADALDGHRGHLSETRGDLRNDRRAGRCDQFPFDVQLPPGHAPQDLGGGRCGQRECTVGALCETVKRGHRAGDDLRPSDQLETDGRADDIDDGVHRAHLMEVNLFRRAAVHPTFGLRESVEDAIGRLLYAVGEVRAADRLPNLLQPPVMVGVRFIEDHTDIRRLDRSLDLPADLDSVPADAQTGEPIPEPIRVRPGADQRSERHVAADSRKAIEIRDLHLYPLSPFINNDVFYIKKMILLHPVLVYFLRVHKQLRVVCFGLIFMSSSFVGWGYYWRRLRSITVYPKV